MAEKNNDTNSRARTSRKDVLLTRKQQQQYRQIRLAILGVVGIIALVLVIAVVAELITRSQPVATVNGTEIGLSDWQEETRFQRVQLIDSVESLGEIFGDNIAQVQQFAGQQINLLSPVRDARVAVGNIALQEMIDVELIRQEAEARGIVVTDQEVQAAIEERYGYFGGDVAPTPTPVDPEPTPTVTPIPAEDEAAAETPPTPEPPPTATPVSEDAFLDAYAADVARYRDVDVSEERYREAIRTALIRDALQIALAEEAGVETESEQVKGLRIAYATEEEAQTALDGIADADDFIETWNTVRSTTPVTTTDPTAEDLPWSDFDTLSSRASVAEATAAFETPVGDVSAVVVVPGDEATGAPDRYVLLLVQDRALRPRPEADLNADRSNALQTWLEDARISEGVIISDIWQSRVPSQPELDEIYFRPQEPPTQPTPQ